MDDKDLIMVDGYSARRQIYGPKVRVNRWSFAITFYRMKISEERNIFKVRSEPLVSLQSIETRTSILQDSERYHLSQYKASSEKFIVAKPLRLETIPRGRIIYYTRRRIKKHTF